MSDPLEQPDLTPNSAGDAAKISANSFIDEAWGDQPLQDDPPAEQPAEQPIEQPPTEEQPVEQPPEEGPIGSPPEDLTGVPEHVVRKGEKSITTWRQLRAERDEFARKVVDTERDRLLKEQELAELKEKLEKVPSEEELEKLKEELATAKSRLSQVDLAGTPEFQEQFDKPINELFGRVVQKLMQAGHEEKEALSMARKVFRPGVTSPQSIEEVLPDESSVVVGALSALLESRDPLLQKREEALKEHQQTMEALQLERNRKASMDISAQLTRVAEKAFEEVGKGGSWLFVKGADEKWNEGVEARRNAALGYLRAGKPDVLARLIFEGIASPVYRKSFEKVKADLDDLRKKYEAVISRRPGLEARAPARPGEDPPEAAPTTVGGIVDQVWSET